MCNSANFLKKIDILQAQQDKMPLVLKKDENDFSIRIWHSTESFEELLKTEALSSADKKKWENFQSDKRKREWLTVRVLLRTFFPASTLPLITYDQFGKPSLDINRGISISHTKEFVAIIITDKANAGIDIETLRDRITVLSSKFCNKEELNAVPALNRIEYLHVLWGAKEVLYKLHGRGEMDFRAHLHVEPFQFEKKGTVNASVHKNDRSSSHLIAYQLWNNMMLTYSTSD